MTALIFDTTRCKRTLIDAGISSEHAEAHAQAMSEAIIALTEEFVTKDYLDLRLEALETRLSGHMNVRFAEIDGKFRTLYLMNGIVIASLVIPLFKTMA